VGSLTSGEIQAIDMESERILRTYSTSASRIDGLVLSRDGSVLLANAPAGQQEERLLCACDLEDGRKLWQQGGYVYACTGSVGRQTDEVVLQNPPGEASFVDLHTGETRRSLPLPQRTAWWTRFVFSPDGKRLYGGLADDRMYAFDAESGNVLWNAPG